MSEIAKKRKIKDFFKPVSASSNSVIESKRTDPVDGSDLVEKEDCCFATNSENEIVMTSYSPLHSPNSES